MKKSKKPLMSVQLKMKIMDAMVYSCILIILVWAILKAAGVFSTPFWLELIPLIAGAIGAFIAFYKFGYAFGVISTDVHYLKRDVDDLKKDTADIKIELKGFRRDYDYHILKHHG